MLGIRTHGGRMVGADASTDVWQYPLGNMQFLILQNYLHRYVKAFRYLSKDRFVEQQLLLKFQ